jgi:hypothetical protein
MEARLPSSFGCERGRRGGTYGLRRGRGRCGEEGLSRETREGKREGEIGLGERDRSPSTAAAMREMAMGKGVTRNNGKGRSELFAKGRGNARAGRRAVLSTDRPI